MGSLSVSVQNVLQSFAENPSIFGLQIGVVALVAVVVFFVLFATRDIMTRTDSLLLQIFFIVLVAALPVVGFFLYLLLRPSRTLSEKRMQADLAALVAHFMPPPAPVAPPAVIQTPAAPPAQAPAPLTATPEVPSPDVSVAVAPAAPSATEGMPTPTDSSSAAVPVGASLPQPEPTPAPAPKKHHRHKKK